MIGIAASLSVLPADSQVRGKRTTMAAQTKNTARFNFIPSGNIVKQILVQ
jgi:hypothetical protein